MSNSRVTPPTGIWDNAVTELNATTQGFSSKPVRNLELGSRKVFKKTFLPELVVWIPPKGWFRCPILKCMFLTFTKKRFCLMKSFGLRQENILHNKNSSTHVKLFRYYHVNHSAKTFHFGASHVSRLSMLTNVSYPLVR